MCRVLVRAGPLRLGFEEQHVAWYHKLVWVRLYVWFTSANLVHNLEARTAL